MEIRADRSAMLLIHDLWFRPSIWAPWLQELDEAGYDTAVLRWSGEDQPSGTQRPAEGGGFNALLHAASRHIDAFGSPPIVVGHGVGAVVAERLLLDGDAAAAISLAPAPGGYSVIPAAARLLRRNTRLALLSLRNSPVKPAFPQFRRSIANVGGATDVRHLYDTHVTAATPRHVLLGALRRGRPARNSRPRRGPLLLAVGGEDQLIREFSTALLHRNYRRDQPSATTDYKVFPGLDHTFGLGTQSMAVLFYCLDWLTSQNL